MSTVSKNNFLHGIVSLLFTGVGKKKEFRDKLHEVVRCHHINGIQAADYGIVGEVCIYGTNCVILFANHTVLKNFFNLIFF